MNIEFEPSGTQVMDGFLVVRLDFYPEIGDKTYAIHYIDEVDKNGKPTGNKVLNPCLCHITTIPENVQIEDLTKFIGEQITSEVIKTLDDVMVLPGSAHYASPLMRNRKIITPRILTKNYIDLVESTKEKLQGFNCIVRKDTRSVDIQPQTIDVGGGADWTNSYVGTGTTNIDKTNPANASGNIDTYQLFVNGSGTSTDNKVGLFYLVSGTTYRTRTGYSIGAVTRGSKQTFTGLTMAVVTGDIAGWYNPGYYLNCSSSVEGDGQGRLEYAGDSCDTDDENDFGADVNTRVLSLYATGTEAGGLSIPIVMHHRFLQGNS